MKVEINHYKLDNGISEIIFKYVMDYDIWKKTFKEFLERYDKEKATK